jgi:hypothetical protein
MEGKARSVGGNINMKWIKMKLSNVTMAVTCWNIKCSLNVRISRSQILILEAVGCNIRLR